MGILRRDKDDEKDEAMHTPAQKPDPVTPGGTPGQGAPKPPPRHPERGNLPPFPSRYSR